MDNSQAHLITVEGSSAKSFNGKARRNWGTLEGETIEEHMMRVDNYPWMELNE